MNIKDWGLGKMVAVLAGLGFVILTALTLLAMFTLDFRGGSREWGPQEWKMASAKAELGDVREAKARAEAGDARAQHFMGMMTLTGTGVPRDPAKATDWFRKSAEQGLAQAQNNLALQYKFGEGAPENREEAIRWSARSANQGNAVGQSILAGFYDDGKSTNVVLAYKWYTLATQDDLVYLKGHLNNLKKTMTKEQIAEGDRLVKEFVAVKDYVEVKK